MNHHQIYQSLEEEYMPRKERTSRIFANHTTRFQKENHSAYQRFVDWSQSKVFNASSVEIVSMPIGY